MKKYIPNFITLLNLATGLTGLVFVFHNELNLAIYLVFLCGLFDFLDGFAARMLKSYSDLGKSLDSLADVVSFGVLPAFIAFSAFSVYGGDEFYYQVFPWMALLIPVFSAVRLAKFNIDDSQSISFSGLPTPANAFMVISAVFVFLNQGKLIPVDEFMLLIVVLTGCFLMTSQIRMFSLKITSITKKKNLLLIAYIAVSLILVLLLFIEGILIAILLYILISIIFPSGFSK